MVVTRIRLHHEFITFRLLVCFIANLKPGAPSNGQHQTPIRPNETRTVTSTDSMVRDKIHLPKNYVRIILNPIMRFWAARIHREVGLWISAKLYRIRIENRIKYIKFMATTVASKRQSEKWNGRIFFFQAIKCNEFCGRKIEMKNYANEKGKSTAHTHTHFVLDIPLIYFW